MNEWKFYFSIVSVIRPYGRESPKIVGLKAEAQAYPNREALKVYKHEWLSVAERSNGEQRLIHPPLQLRRLLPSSIKIHPMIVKSEFLVFVFLLCFVIKQTISLINFGKTSRRQMITTHFINHRVCHKSWRLRAFASETIWLKTLLCRMACPCCEWSHQSTNVHLIWLSFFFSLTEPNAMLNRHKSFSQAF